MASNKAVELNFPELQPEEKKILEALLKKKPGMKITEVFRKGDVPGDIIISGRYSIPGSPSDPFEFSSWLPLEVIKQFGEWTEPKIAKMTDYPDMATDGDWSAVRDTKESSIWAIYFYVLGTIWHLINPGDPNPFELYDKDPEAIKTTTARIKQAIIDGEIVVEKDKSGWRLIDKGNVLAGYRSIGADDTASREAIGMYILAHKKPGTIVQKTSDTIKDVDGKALTVGDVVEYRDGQYQCMFDGRPFLMEYPIKKGSKKLYLTSLNDVDGKVRVVKAWHETEGGFMFENGGGVVSRTEKMKNIESFLSQFPDNATYWKQAGDELPSMHNDLAEYFSDYKGNKWTTHGGTLPLEARAVPSIRNKTHKEAINKLIEKLNEHDFNKFYKDHEPWFSRMAKGGVIAPAGKFIVVCTAVGNPDFNQATHKPFAPQEKFTISNPKEASEKCRAYIEKHDLGGGNWSGGQVYNDRGEAIAHVSYNGRVWPGNEWQYNKVEITNNPHFDTGIGEGLKWLGKQVVATEDFTGYKLKEPFEGIVIHSFGDSVAVSKTGEFTADGNTEKFWINQITEKMATGGAVGAEKKYTSVAPEGTCFIKLDSHRASDHVNRTGIEHIELYNLYGKGTAGQSVILIYKKDYYKIKNIRHGVSEPIEKLVSKGMVWRAKWSDTEAKELYNIYQLANSGEYEDGGGLPETQVRFKAFYKGKQTEVTGTSLSDARKKAVAYFKAEKKPWDVTIINANADVTMLEKGGKLDYERRAAKEFGAIIGKQVNERGSVEVGDIAMDMFEKMQDLFKSVTEYADNDEEVAEFTIDSFELDPSTIADKKDFGKKVNQYLNGVAFGNNAAPVESDVKIGEVIDKAGSNSKYKVMKLWDGFERGDSSRPVTYAKIQRLKTNGEPVTSEKPEDYIVKFKYEKGGGITSGLKFSKNEIELTAKDGKFNLDFRKAELHPSKWPTEINLMQWLESKGATVFLTHDPIVLGIKYNHQNYFIAFSDKNKWQLIIPLADSLSPNFIRIESKDRNWTTKELAEKVIREIESVGMKPVHKKMEAGGKTHDHKTHFWIADAIKHKGSVIKKAITEGWVKKGEKLSHEALEKIKALGKGWAKKATLAETLAKFELGGNLLFPTTDEIAQAQMNGWTVKYEGLKKQNGKFSTSYVFEPVGDTFDSKKEVISHILEKVKDGSTLEKKALRFIKKMSPLEWVAVTKVAGKKLIPLLNQL